MSKNEVLKTYQVNTCTVEIVHGDITKEDVDLIVNAANSSLMGGGGVDGAIHGAGGPDILKQCREIRSTQYLNGLPTGEVVFTTGGNLISNIIHTVGPIFGSSYNPDEELANCYKNCIDLMLEKNYSSITFPAISTGVYGFPKDRAARVVSQVINQISSQEFVKNAKDLSIHIRLIFFKIRDAEVFIENCLVD